MVHLLSNTMVRLSWLTLATLSVLTPAARSASLGSPPSDSRQAEASAVGVVGGVGGVAGGGGGGGVGGVAGGGDVAVSGVDVGYNSQLTDQLFGDELAPIVFDSLPFYLQVTPTIDYLVFFCFYLVLPCLGCCLVHSVYSPHTLWSRDFNQSETL